MLNSVGYILGAIRPYAGNSGTCNQVTQLRYMNAARSLLYNKTDSAATMEYCCIRCVDYCLTLPSIYKQIRLAWIDGIPTSLGNEWYQSIPQIGILRPQNSCHRKIVEVGGSHVTFQNYNGGPYQLGVETESPLDTGTEITFFGEDAYGTRKKETITLAAAPTMVLSVGSFQSVYQVTKGETKGRVRLYAYNPNIPEQQLLAVYQPYDINPSFRKFKVQGRVHHSITIYAKKNFVELNDVNDQCEFTPEAMIHAVMAVVYRENKGSEQEYAANLQLAIAEVNRETADQEEQVGSPLRNFGGTEHALIPSWCGGDNYGMPML